MIDLIFSIASHEEVSEITKLVNSVYRGETSREGWTTEADLLDGQRADDSMIYQMMQNQNGLFLIAQNKEAKLLGSVYLENKKDHAYLGMLAVSALHQNQRIGAQLLGEAEKLVFEKWKLSEMRMTVITIREELISYYLRRGYLRTGLVEDFPQDEKFGIVKGQKLYLETLSKKLKLG